MATGERGLRLDPVLVEQVDVVKNVLVEAIPSGCTPVSNDDATATLNHFYEAYETILFH